MTPSLLVFFFLFFRKQSWRRLAIHSNLCRQQVQNTTSVERIVENESESLEERMRLYRFGGLCVLLLAFVELCSDERILGLKHSSSSLDKGPDQEYNNTEMLLDPMRENRTFFFVHLGKAAGTTIYQATTTPRSYCLERGNPKKRKTCLKSIKNDTRDEMVISSRIVGSIHNRVQGLHLMRRAGAFLWPVRDPFDRITSAFYMQHPENGKGCQRAQKNERYILGCLCFQHVQDLVLELSSPNETKRVVSPATNDTLSCRQIAQEALTQNNQRWGHLSMNFGYYYDRTIAKYPRKDVVVLRTEHLWDDLQQLEYWMGGNASVGPSTRNTVSHGSETYRLKSKLTDVKLLQSLCCIIELEAKLYIEIIQRAINLHAWQKQESLEAFSERCNLDLCHRETLPLPPTNGSETRV